MPTKSVASATSAGTEGKRKIRMEYMTDPKRRQITFSKRKSGLMRKAWEIATLTGGQILVLAVSEKGKVHGFATNRLRPMLDTKNGKAYLQWCLYGGSVEPEAPRGGEAWAAAASGVEATDESTRYEDDGDEEEEEEEDAAAAEEVEATQPPEEEEEEDE